MGTESELTLERYLPFARNLGAIHVNLTDVEWESLVKVNVIGLDPLFCSFYLGAIILSDDLPFHPFYAAVDADYNIVPQYVFSRSFDSTDGIPFQVNEGMLHRIGHKMVKVEDC